jgi:hypothetical protein
MATKIWPTLNPRGYYICYRDTEIAALKHLADWLLREGLEVKMAVGIYNFELTAIGHGRYAGGEHVKVRASIKPYRDGSGLSVDAERGVDERKMFDGQDYMFLHDDAEGIVRLTKWFDE